MTDFHSKDVGKKLKKDEMEGTFTLLGVRNLQQDEINHCKKTNSISLTIPHFFHSVILIEQFLECSCKLQRKGYCFSTMT